MLYLIHFDRPFHHARHYVGFSDDVERREVRHKAGNGSRLLRAVSAAGIGYQIARTWEGDRNDERAFKRRKNSARYCPICHPENAADPIRRKSE